MKVTVYPGCSLESTASEYMHSLTTVFTLMDIEIEELKDWNCCGASLAIPRSDMVITLTSKIIRMALEAGANAIITACPLCHTNLDTIQREAAVLTDVELNLPVIFITELMAFAFGEENLSALWNRHFINPAKILEEAVEAGC
ncbi:MAG: hypothetical protein DRP87_07010 [Spirochaetes bacterium]|nr:MAG: hypothetical protein DRP87_07010 [Spirochaetota bacterium]